MSHHNNNRLNNNVQEYKGMFFNENKDKTYFEGGAHFSSRELAQRLKVLTKTLSPDRIIKPIEAHQKTKSFAIEKITVKAINKKNPSNSHKRDYDSLDQKKVKGIKSNRLMLQTISNGKEESLPAIRTINKEIIPLQKEKQLKPKVKLNPININKESKKKFPIIKQTKEKCSSRNINKLILQKNNTLTNPYLSIDTQGQQLTERKLVKMKYQTKTIKYV